MEIGDKIKLSRRKSGITQKELAKRIGVTTRSIQYYEGNIRKPQSTEIIIKLAAALGEEINYFLSDNEISIMQANEMLIRHPDKNYSDSPKMRTKKLLEEARLLLGSNDFSEEDKDSFFRAFSEIYFESKNYNKKKNDFI